MPIISKSATFVKTAPIDMCFLAAAIGQFSPG
jgi:hypothetical protein